MCVTREDRSSLLEYECLLLLDCWHCACSLGLAFLEENKNKPGVVTLPSGLQYKVLKKGRGPSIPTIDSKCSCHYEGKMIDGSVFDSSFARGKP